MSEGKCLDKCISAGMSLQRDSDSYRADKSTHVGAAGCDILAWIMTCSGVTVVYEKDGCCGIAHGLQNELMQQPLIDTTKQMWMGGKCQEEKQKT